MVEPEWLGRRVVIRYALDRDDSGRLRFSDVVGDLLHVSDDAVTVEARTGPVTVPSAHVAVARLVEPSAAAILRLEDVGARGWRAAETAHAGGWLLRANRGCTSRANSALPLHAPTTSLDATLDAARAWYAERGLPLRVQLSLHARRLLDAALAERGWPASPDVHVLVRRLDAVASPAEVRLTGAPDEAWLARFRDGTTPPEARELMTRHDRVAFAEVRRDGHTVAIGRGTVDDGWLGITAVEVTPELRRQGLAADTVHALWTWARDEHRATRTYLHVEDGNTAALRLYARLGYWPHHVYRHRAEPPATP